MQKHKLAYSLPVFFIMMRSEAEKWAQLLLLRLITYNKTKYFRLCVSYKAKRNLRRNIAPKGGKTEIVTL